MQQLNGQTVIVSGGASGIGYAVSAACAAAGAAVAIVDLNEEAAAAAAKTLSANGATVRPYAADVTEAAAVTRVVASIEKDLGIPNGLVNNTCGGMHEKQDDQSSLDWKTWEQRFRAVMAPGFTMMASVVPRMIAGGKGAVVNIGSVSGLVIGGESSAYHVAKAAIAHWTRVLAHTYGASNIRVNCVCPGFIVRNEHRARFLAEENAKYRMIAEHAHPLRRVGRPEDVAAAIVFLLSDAAGFITGQSLVIDGGLTLNDPFVLGLTLNRQS